jgi:hypothetical protein
MKTTMTHGNLQDSVEHPMLGWTPLAESARTLRCVVTPGGTASPCDSGQRVDSTSVSKLKSALISLQNRSTVRFSTLLLVWHLILLTIGSVAYDLLPERSTVGF